jgi:hypothetical protein
MLRANGSVMIAQTPQGELLCSFVAAWKLQIKAAGNRAGLETLQPRRLHPGAARPGNGVRLPLKREVGIPVVTVGLITARAQGSCEAGPSGRPFVGWPRPSYRRPPRASAAARPRSVTLLATQSPMGDPPACIQVILSISLT